jgi:hypothetical protein
MNFCQPNLITGEISNPRNPFLPFQRSVEEARGMALCAGFHKALDFVKALLEQFKKLVSQQ